ncbi:MAG TPA: MbcA/ParS/Xre antitoxin family protein [Gammaproteobacteria bacterium]|nr:MbcA/ParS/Xre antitoxin family protein [Gammaproteobacteria bacterium]
MWTPTDGLLRYLKDVDVRMDALVQEQAELHLRLIEHLGVENPALVKRLLDTFGSAQKAAAWLLEDVPSLGSRRPITLIRNGEQDQVIDTLGHIQHGIPS